MELAKATLMWLRMAAGTAVVSFALTIIVTGLVLRYMVSARIMFAKTALYVVSLITEVAGRFIGAVFVSIALILLWSEASDWISNEVLVWMGHRQLDFQQWLTRKIGDPTVSSIIGPKIAGQQYGQQLIAIFYGTVVSWIIKAFLQVGFHKRKHEELLRTLGHKPDPTSIWNRLRSLIGLQKREPTAPSAAPVNDYHPEA